MTYFSFLFSVVLIVDMEFLFWIGNDSDGALRLCLLAIVAHLGNSCDTPIIPSHSSLWNDVSVSFFLEKQFLGSVLFVLPIWTQSGENLLALSLGFGLWEFGDFSDVCDNFSFCFRLAWPSCYLLSSVNPLRRQEWAFPYLLWALWLRHEPPLLIIYRSCLLSTQRRDAHVLFICYFVLIAARNSNSRFSLHTWHQDYYPKNLVILPA